MDRSSPSLTNLPLRELLAQLSDRTPAPGGGSAAALACSLAAGLVEMAAKFTLAAPELADRHDRMRAVRARAAELGRQALALAERELDAYAPVLEALRLPAEESDRQARVQAARSLAADSPLEVTQVGAELAGLGAEVAGIGNRNLVGDAVVGALLAEAACRAGACLVELNLSGAPDDARLRQSAEYVRRAWQARITALQVNADAYRMDR